MKKILLPLSLLTLALILAGAGCVSFGGQKPPAATGTAGMYISVDKGENWSQISLLPTAAGVKNISNSDVYRLFFDPQDPAALYWATRAEGFYYSYDEGRSWRQPVGDLQEGFIYSIEVHPENKCVIYVATAVKILKSEDCNRSWTEVYRESRSDTRLSSLAINPLAPYQIFAALSNGDLLESRDDGRSWQTINRFKTEIVDVVADPLQKDVLYVTTRKAGLYRSRDTGASWTALKDTMKDYGKALEYRRFLAHPSVPGHLYWVSTYGILLSTDSGDSWEAIELITPPGAAQIFGFYVGPDNPDEIYYTATINNRSTFYKSFDGGERWITKNLPSGQLPSFLYIHPLKTEIIYLGFIKIGQK